VAKGARVTLVVSKGTERVAVPDVTGSKLADATVKLTGAGFTVRTTEEYSDSVRKGSVITQSPSAGVEAEIGSQVVLTVSKGSDFVLVPDVIGGTETDAKLKLERAGLRALVNYQTSPDDGIVLTSLPIPGASARLGDTVTIWVGRAPAMP
jgi:serine/threonine-protein kinase